MILLTLLLHVLPTAFTLSYRAADFSSLLLVESQGVNYTDAGVTLPFETILATHGCNTARIRVWTAAQYDLEYSLAMAKRVKAAGMTLIVDLHYSDIWADPGHQAIPSGWPANLTGLMAEMYNYTAGIVTSFAAQGTPIDILQVGNEINSGLLWPVGEVSLNGLEPVSLLLKSAVQGAKSVVGSQRILIHLANGWDWDDLSYWYSGVFGTPGGLTLSDVDVMGVSFYPFYGTNATLAALSSSLHNLTSAYGKEVVVAETDWPVVCPNVTLSEPGVPVSVLGQEIWSNDIEDVLLSLPNGLGQGIFYWEPGWIGNAALGSGCADNLLVTASGATRQSINIFGWDM
ncbi:Probable arabinogalactan endo-beta-1,4-galactanase [Sparassis crispa]|uniref:Arabinogalactan endo-beta-1,4-galactanase n=1 Tax=Sparassis crispa TaxID=139825 RepID=A0A401GCP2_9APHY|nr:Probable arabinogalactan endo-beta-1,4-galactanase [Sparassis crispa]GBE79893.1 Probable arabinogalactan endo-beta-1,4-galactanase [Sparassis crispa]